MIRLLICIAVLACNAIAKPRDLVVFHTNDIHGHFVPEVAEWRDDKAMVGGVVTLESKLKELRSRFKHNLYLDAGDLMTGNPICNIEHNGVKGAALLEMLSRVNIDAQCVGNHEFDLGGEHLRQFISAAPYPLLCANVIDSATGKSIAAPFHIANVNGMRVGIIGLILDDLSSVVSKQALQSFQVQSSAKTAQHWIDEIDAETDLIVLLTHIGVEDDSILAASIHGADVIVGGHSHTRLNSPKRVNGVVIVQAGSYCKNLGVLELKVDGDSVVSYNGKLVELLAPVAGRRTELGKFTDGFETEIQAKYGQVIAELSEAWTRGYYDQSGVGNWICDHLRMGFKADIALVNAGGIRANLKAGPITMLNVMELLPFENAIVTFEAKGSELEGLALEQARAVSLHSHGVLESSGMIVNYAKEGENVRVTGIEIGGQQLDRQKNYRIVSIDYVAVSQADRYLGFAPKNLEATGTLINEFIGNAMQQSPQPIKADSAPRIIEQK